jgi:taurine dioxygenase
MRVRQLSPALGAEVIDVDLGGPIDGSTMAALTAAFHEHCVLVFRGQHLDPVRQEAFTAMWGTPLVVPYLQPHQVPGSPPVLRVTNMGKANTLTENWHYDSAYFDVPPPIAILAAQEIPATGGDTMWANQYLAYEALSPAMQDLIGGLRAAFTGTMPDDDGVRHEVVTFHPVVRTHRATGRRALGTGRIESVPYFEGMTHEESRGLLEFLYEHAARPEFVYRHRWDDGDVVMWDNRCLLHYAIHDYGDATRLMHRTTVIDPYDEQAGNTPTDEGAT